MSETVTKVYGVAKEIRISEGIAHVYENNEDLGAILEGIDGSLWRIGNDDMLHNIDGSLVAYLYKDAKRALK